MNFKKPQFSRNAYAEFSETLKKRVNGYFNDPSKNRHADLSMKLKTVLMLSLFLVPLVLMLTGVVTSVGLMFVMWSVMGIGMAGIGTCIMHDALHGVYSKKQQVNKLLGLTMNLIGANATVWKIQHNTLHHSFTNVDHIDDDIAPRLIMRFSPNQKKYWFHRYQHIYAWFFYGISTVMLVGKTFYQLIRYYKLGLAGNRKQFYKSLINMFLWKVFYFGYILVLPMLLLPASPLLIVLMFITMHFITGTLLTAIFQPAHVVDTSVFIDGKEDVKHEWNWTVHQFLTTANYAPKSRLFSWLIGGLNFQIEHHLFPNVCHVHYHKISPIVKQTALEYNIPYHTNKTFFDALRMHTLMLKNLGR